MQGLLVLDACIDTCARMNTLYRLGLQRRPGQGTSEMYAAA